MSSTNNLNRSNEEPKLKRTLSLPVLLMFGLAFLAPTAVLNDYGIWTVETKGMYTLSLTITAVVMLVTAFSYVSMVRAFPLAGSAYTYVQKSVQPHIGFLTGWVMILDYMLLPMICYLLLGLYVNEYFPALPVWLIVVIAAVLGAIFNIVGVKSASVFDGIISGAEVVFALLCVVVALKYVSDGGGTGTLVDTKSFFNPTEFHAGGVFMAAAVLTVDFVGFDAVSTMVEETKNPKKTMAPAILGVTIVAGIVFILTGYGLQISWPDAYSTMEDPNVGIFEWFPMVGANWLGDVFFVVDNLASFVCAMAAMSAVSRVLYGMGRDNILPKKVFGKLSKRFHTPVINIIIASVISLSALFYQDDLLGANSLISFGAITGFIMVNISVIVHYYIKGKERGGIKTFKYLILPIIGALSLIVVFVFIEEKAKILGLIWLAIGFVYLLIKTKGFKELPPEMNLDENQEIE